MKIYSMRKKKKWELWSQIKYCAWGNDDVRNLFSQFVLTGHMVYNVHGFMDLMFEIFCSSLWSGECKTWDGCVCVCLQEGTCKICMSIYLGKKNWQQPSIGIFSFIFQFCLKDLHSCLYMSSLFIYLFSSSRICDIWKFLG